MARPWRIARYGISISRPGVLFYLKSEIGSDANVERPCLTWRDALKYHKISSDLVLFYLKSEIGSDADVAFPCRTWHIEKDTES